MKKIIKEISIDDFNNQIAYSQYEEYFTKNEIEKFGIKNNKASLAARYLIKRILMEWVGEVLEPVDMEILNNEYGCPQIFSGKISRELLEKIHFSISHTKDMAIALVIIDR